ncbi:hypothetical protein EDD85DRAFT_832268 [Armillaria nabsnona]|nr:hypothetical protein EDD85DRAFT_832268 [Armillaria nabsnona]
MSDLDLKAILDFTVALAYDAGKLIIEGSEAILQPASVVDTKKNTVDLVTEYDVRVEELVKERLGEKYPSFQFIGEESYAAGARPEWTDEPTWCVDPIDGTTNFVHGFPMVALSIALLVERRSVLGIIYNPFLETMYTGIKDGGSYVTKGGPEGVRRKLPFANPPQPLPSLSKAQLAVEWGFDRRIPPLAARAESFHRLVSDAANGIHKARMAHSLRSLGTSAMNFVYVAQGAFDMYWEIGPWPWDVAAGVIIAQEAGGLVTGSHEIFDSSKDTITFGEVGEEILTSRKYLVIRPIGDSENETGRETQKRIISEFYETVIDYDTV